MFLLSVLCASAVILLVGFLIWRQWFETYHLAVVDPGKLYRDGNRGVREYANMLRKVAPKTVVTLIDDEELVAGDKPEFAAESRLLQSRRDIELVRIPVKLGGWPDGDAIERFLAIASDQAKQPVVVHCAQGVRRTGMMAAAYQMSVLGWSKERTKREMLTFGHSMRTVGDVQRFIDVYDPQQRRMVEALPQSKE
jgi:hypothetical protein